MPASAQSIGSEPMPGLRVSGFGTLGVVHASAPAGWGYRRDVSQAANDGGTRGDVDTRLGLQASYTATSQLEFVSQWLLTRRAPNGPANDRLSWLFAAWRPRPDVATRLGRINLDVFTLADYRDVGFAYVQVRAPVEYYAVLPSWIDGADIERTLRLDDALWRGRLYTGLLSGGDRPSHSMVKARHAVGATVTRETDQLQLRVAVLTATLVSNPVVVEPLLDGLGQVSTLPIASVAADAAAMRNRIELAGKRVSYLSLGLVYEQRPWTWRAEVYRIAGVAAFNSAAGYLTLERRLGDVQVFGSFSRVRPTEDARTAPSWEAALAPVLGAPAAAQAQALANFGVQAARYSVDQHTLSVGARWDFNANAALKLQWDRVSIRPGGAGLWTGSTPVAANARVISTTLDFVW